ncbi:hypothetical protein [Actinoplanes sp. CA-252034]|uniref:hypothetical protein n=1 Tax=Actinoplanes sp. CA-252034 TaxID=3239906 RepID=UPI003D99272C
MRFAAAVGWLCATTEPVPDRMLDLFAEVVDVRLAEAMDDVPWPNHHLRGGGLAAWLVAFLGGLPDARTDLVARLVVSPHPSVRASALRSAHAVACERRSRTGEMIGLLADRLHDTEPAARRLVRVGAAAADRIADALDDPVAEVWAWTVVMLARLGDARAVEPLADLLARPAYPWPEPRRHPAGNPDPGHPGPVAAAHAPVIRARLSADNDVATRVEAAFALWSATGDTVPVLTAVLDESWGWSPFGSAHTAVADHLARIGPAAVPALTAFLEADSRIEHWGLNDPIDGDHRCRQSATAALRVIRPAPR